MIIIQVSTTQQLTAALANAAPGAEIHLAAGSYGAVAVFGKTFVDGVKIVGAANNMSVISDLRVDDVKNVTFENLVVGRALADGEPSWTFMARVRNSESVQFKNVLFRGSLDGNPANDGVGLTVSDTKGLIVDRSEFQQLFRGLTIQRGEDSTVTNNKFHEMRSDGVQVAASDNTEIAANFFTNFYPTTSDHPDAIQFFNLGQTKGSDGISIHDNVIMQGIGKGFQGIWISDGREYAHRNVTIENNMLFSNDYYHGIGIGDTQGAKVTHNTVVSDPGDKESFWIYLRNSSNVEVSFNVTDDIKMDSTATLVNLHDNIVLREQPRIARDLPGLVKDFNAQIDDLVIDHYGYSSGSFNVTGMGISQSYIGPVSVTLAGIYRNFGSQTTSASVMKSSVENDAEAQSRKEIGYDDVAGDFGAFPSFFNHSLMIDNYHVVLP